MTITPTGDGFTYDKDGTGIRKSADLVGVVGMATAPLSMAGSGITAAARRGGGLFSRQKHIGQGSVVTIPLGPNHLR